MKSIFTSSLLALILVLGYSGQAQTPKDGAIIKLDRTDISIESGTEASVQIQVIRSKRYQKTKLGLPVVASSIEGLAFVINEGDESDQYLLAIKADEGIAPGKHTLVIKGDAKWGRKIRSSLLSVEVVNAGSAVSSKQ